MKKILFVLCFFCSVAHAQRAIYQNRALGHGFNEAQARFLGETFFKSSTSLYYQFNASGELVQNSTQGGALVMPRADIAGDGIILGPSSVNADVTASALYGFTDSSTVHQFALAQGSANSTGIEHRYYKSRATDGSADTIVSNNDVIAQINFLASNGTAFDSAAKIIATINGTPGASADMPGRLDFQTTSDGSATSATALRLDADKSALFTGTVTSSRSTDLGWAVVDGTDNTACTSQCTNAAVFGFDLAGGATAPVIKGPSDATSDICLCAGAS